MGRLLLWFALSLCGLSLSCCSPPYSSHLPPSLPPFLPCPSLPATNIPSQPTPRAPSNTMNTSPASSHATNNIATPRTQPTPPIVSAADPPSPKRTKMNHNRQYNLSAPPIPLPSPPLPIVRNLHPLPPFSPSWLLNKQNEAKATAHPTPTPTQLLTDARVYKASQTFLTTRNSNWQYAFERCATSQRNQSLIIPGPKRPGIFAAYSTPTDSASTTARYNATLATELVKIAKATKTLHHLQSNGTAAEKATRNANDFRVQAYEKTCKLIATYPIPVTLTCIAPTSSETILAKHREKTIQRTAIEKRKTRGAAVTTPTKIQYE